LNPLQKNIALWLVISLIFVLLFHLFNQPQQAMETIVYSDFIGHIERGQVMEVTIQGEKVTGKLIDGRSFRTYAPRDAELVSLLKEKKGENCR
jgi:ATP-dependent Zn proteases